VRVCKSSYYLYTFVGTESDKMIAAIKEK
jgi:hypothetical protein